MTQINKNNQYISKNNALNNKGQEIPSTTLNTSALPELSLSSSGFTPSGVINSKKPHTNISRNKMPVAKLRGLVGHPLNFNTLFHYSNKQVSYSFDKKNNLFPLLTKTEYLLNTVFKSMYSLISKPVYLLKHDKVVIRLFVFLSPKLDKYLDTSSTNIANQFKNKVLSNKIRRFLKFKSLRPGTIEILNTQLVEKRVEVPSLTETKKIASKELDNKNYPYSSLASLFNKKLEKLSVIFGKIFKKKVEFEIIKAQLPFQDSNILAQVIGYSANNYKFRRMLKILVPRAVIKNPSNNGHSWREASPMLAALNLNNRSQIQNSP